MTPLAQTERERGVAAAMLLGAGYGTRLRPLTELRPKPLVPVGGQALLDWHLDALAATGVASVTINASYLSAQIEAHVAERKRRPPMVEVIREETPQGIGRGLLGARHMLEREAGFLVVNADTFHAIDLGEALAVHERSEADVTLVVRRTLPGEPEDELRIEPDGTIGSVPGTKSGWRFAGIHVLNPVVFDHLSGVGSLIAAYRSMLAAGSKLATYDCSDEIWFDVGTPAGYLEANWTAAELASDRPTALSGVEVVEPVLVGSAVEIGLECSIGPRTVIGDGASIGSGSRLSDSVVWPEVSVLPGSTLRRCVAFPDGVLNIPESET